MPYTEWPYGGTTSFGVNRPNSVDSPLMVAIANTGVGKLLTDYNIQIYGWVDPGFNVSSATRRPAGNAPVGYAYTLNTVQLDQAVVYVERTPDTVQNDHADWGFRLSAIYGENYRFTTSYGLASYQLLKRIDIDRAKAARHGLAPGDIDTTIQEAIGGQAAGNLYEPGSDRNFPIIVRLAPQYRSSLDAIRRIAIGAPNPNGDGAVPIPLTDVANARLVSGASLIYREGQERYIPIKFSVRGRDLETAVIEAQKKVAESVLLQGGYHIQWVGEFGNPQDPLDRLEVVVPLSIVLICLLLYINCGSIADMLLSANVIPMALIGGILTLSATGTPFRVSAAIGFVALMGISAMNGIIVVTYFDRMIEAGMERRDAILRTCLVQMRPVTMTCIVTCVGLLPAAFSNGIGSQVQEPLALVVVGGILLAPILILTVPPGLIDLFTRHAVIRDVTAGAAEPAE